MRMIMLSLAMALTFAACRPDYEPTDSPPTSVPSVLPPLYEADSYEELVEQNWTAIADDAPSIAFEEFAKAVEANKDPSEDLEDVYAALFAIASQHAFIQGEALNDRYFLAAAALSCWWHPPGALAPATDWMSMRPGLISNASE